MSDLDEKLNVIGRDVLDDLAESFWSASFWKGDNWTTGKLDVADRLRIVKAVLVSRVVSRLINNGKRLAWEEGRASAGKNIENPYRKVIR